MSKVVHFPLFDPICRVYNKFYTVPTLYTFIAICSEVAIS